MFIVGKTRHEKKCNSKMIYLVITITMLLAPVTFSFVTPRFKHHVHREKIIQEVMHVAILGIGRSSPHGNNIRFHSGREVFVRKKVAIQRYAVSTSTQSTPEAVHKLNQTLPESFEPHLPLPDYVADSLDGRLLSAAQCAYNLTQPYAQSVGYLPGTMAKRISSGVNSVIIGFSYDGITVAFKGTHNSKRLDWIQNAALFLTPVGDRTGFEGKMHAGFYRSTKCLWKPLKELLVDMLKTSEEMGWKQNVYFTGHSKAGAMASVAALLMKRDGDLPDPSYVCTFGSAKVGDSEFRDYYNNKITQISYEAHHDIIPLLPPSASMMGKMNDELADVINGILWSEKSSNKKNTYKWDYQTVGKRKYINKFAEIIDDDMTKELDDQRIRDIEKSARLSMADFTAAHCSSCPDEGCNGYYFKAVNEEGCDMCIDDTE